MLPYRSLQTYLNGKKNPVSHYPCHGFPYITFLLPPVQNKHQAFELLMNHQLRYFQMMNQNIFVNGMNNFFKDSHNK